jgi:hypothetical protein
MKAIFETFNSVRETERDRERVSSGGLWKIYRDPPSISSAGVKKFRLVGMLLKATMQAQQIKSAKHKENLLMMYLPKELPHICKTHNNALEIIIYLCSGLIVDFIV